jgi:hypothetical protein
MSLWSAGRDFFASHLGRPFATACGILLVASGLMALGSCGGDDGTDTGGGGPTLPPIVATPTPAPTAEPPLSASCTRMGMGSPRARCGAQGATFQSDLDDAIRTLRREQPQIFEDDKVLNVGAYYVGLIRILDREGLCAGHDGEELGIKSSDDYNDVFDVLTAKNEVRNFYIGTCFPSVFPEKAAPAPIPAPGGCNLAPSNGSVACGVNGNGEFYEEMRSVIDEVIRERPELFDTSVTAPGTDWPLLKDSLGYHQAVIAALTKRGYCGLFDNEEIQLKKTNEFTEHFDINFQDKYVRKVGIYRGSCYPAAF